MKKSTQAIIISITFAVIVIIIFGATANIFNQKKLRERSTTQSSSSSSSLSPTTTSSTTTATTTATAPLSTNTPPTKKKKTETTTEQTTKDDPLVDLKSLSVIDLYPLSLSGGDWDVKHCQGIAVDKENGYIYYSYTTMLIKCSFEGKIVASVTGIQGHMGDITYNKADGMLYCGHYSTGRTGFYVYIFNTKKIKKMNMKPTKDIVRSVYVKEAYEDYLASFKKKKGEETVTLQHKYGCSGIDGVTMGPDFLGKEKKKELLTVAYGIYADSKRGDNNYQVLLQYDVTGWWDKYGQAVSSTSHRTGPDKCGKYFVYTGNTTWGTQTMEYFDELNIWILNCYKGIKKNFKPFTLFAVDGDIKPKKEKLKGQPKTDRQYVLSLYTDGAYDKKHNIWGWYSDYGVQGVAYMDDGLFYVTQPYKAWTGTKLAISYLNVWKSVKNGKGPFTLSVNVGNDYSIHKAKHVEITTTKASKKENESKNIIDQLVDILGGG